MKIIKKLEKMILFPIGMYFFLLGGTGVIRTIISPKIKTQYQLEQMIIQEKNKIKPHNNYIINGKLVSKHCAYSGKIGNKKYGLEIGGLLNSKSILRHELYHILDGHYENVGELNDFQKWAKYLLWYEHKAIIYEALDVKLE